ncbi:dual specificity phosphatase 12 [Entomortierella lignicola]|nr:dual specificity phosphatase 12 [Entomortierella lignicola]
MAAFPEQPFYSAKNFRDMQEVVPGLYISGAPAAESREYLKAMEITHIIQVTDVPIPRFPGEFIYKLITVPDMDETNLIKHFNDTYTFIQSAIDKGGRVLVHCMAGASRSVTIVCAYLMKSKDLPAVDALKAVAAVRPIAEPNDGFVTQLLLYGKIDYDVSKDRIEYRRFLISSMAAQREMFGYIDDMTLAEDPSNTRPAPPPQSPAADPTASSSTTRTMRALPPRPLKCKKCRRALVARDSIIAHTPGQGQTAFQYRKRNATLHVSEAIQSDISPIQPQSSISCQSYFIEPVEWIQGLQGLEGKISCPQCDSKLGAFNWSGDQCSCGTWVTPAFMLHKGKVDA